jgi:hydrogenase maturation factor
VTVHTDPMPEVVAETDGLPADSLAQAALTVARRFAAGATMWCVAPEWPAHARHVAVEFVHPVIMGKRALPAVAVDAGPTGYAPALRLLVRPGDVLVAVGPASEGTTQLLRRAEAWGLVSVWLGAGARPEPVATHLVWSDAADAGRAARSGDIVILYHLLWELTHVVFEHPGLLETPAEAACEGEVCITCSDEGRVAEIRSVAGGGQAEVIAGGQMETIDVTLVEPVRAGDVVLVHAGVALHTLDRDEDQT